MECFYRVTFGNQVSTWRRGKSHHMGWIRSYDEQPPHRGRENEVIVGRSGEETVLFCTSERNDYLSRHTMGGQRVEIAWCREGDRNALLQSFSAGDVNPP